MPCTGGKFKPQPNETIMLRGQKYTVQPHPGAPNSAFCAEGRRAVVYNLMGPNKSTYALKVFKPKFRSPDLLVAAKQAERFGHLPGMRAAHRIVIGPADREATDCPDLLYSALMPWIGGQTWNDLLIQAEKGGAVYGLNVALPLCVKFLQVMTALEQAGTAHTDIAPGNVVVDLQAIDVQLLDLEDLYVPGAPPPATQNTGTPGYRHPSADQGKTTWCAEGDRYSTAIMAAEMVLLANPALRAQLNDNGLFEDRKAPESSARFNAALPFFKSVAPEFAARIERAWKAPTLENCPRASELLATVATLSVPNPPAAMSGVTWEPILPPASTVPPQISWQQPTNPPTGPQSARTPLTQTAPPTSQPRSSGTGPTWHQPPPPQTPAKFPPFQPPTIQRRATQSASRRRWMWFGVVMLLLALVIAGTVYHSHADQRRSEDEKRLEEQNRQEELARQEQQRQAQLQQKRRGLQKPSAGLQEGQTAGQTQTPTEPTGTQPTGQNESAPSSGASAAEMENWLRQKKAQIADYAISVRLHNACSTQTVYTAVRFKIPDNSNRWATMGWYPVKPGEDFVPPVVTTNTNVYFYTETSSGPLPQDGDPGAVSENVVQKRFLHADGDSWGDTTPETVTMFHKHYSDLGEHTLSINCPNG